MTAKEVFKKIEKAMPYIRASGGGVTISGGEPLLQPDFLTALFRLCRKSSVHTAVDTSGFFSKKDSKKIQGLLNLTDLFIMDIKSADAKQHKRLTARELKESLFFIAMLEKKKRPYWLRYVLVPGSNDSKEDIRRLNKLMQPLRYCQRFEFLPYHTLGSHKWAALGLRYPLKDARSATTKDIDRANRLLNKNE
jgi:pyruvate formate lyase activating enzyme